MIIPRGQILVSRPDDDHPCADSKSLPCVDSKTSPCMLATRAHAFQHVRAAGNTRTCFSACARLAGIHGDVLNLHTEAFNSLHTGFSACNTTPHHTTPHHTTPHHTTPHDDTHDDTHTTNTRRKKTEREEKTKERKRKRKRK